MVCLHCSVVPSHLESVITNNGNRCQYADYNDNDVMVVKFKGEYPFHKHETTDDFFYVLEGEMIMDIEGKPSQVVRAGELFVVPKGVVHRPRAETEVKVLLIEPKGEPNSGDSEREPAPKPRI